MILKDGNPPYFGAEYDLQLWKPDSRRVPHVAGLLKDIGAVPIDFPELAREAGAFSEQYMRWELNRRFFGKRVTGDVTETRTGINLPSTGFEGYYVGLQKSPQDIVSDIAAKGHGVIAAIRDILPHGTSIDSFINLLHGNQEPRAHFLWENTNRVFVDLIQRLRSMRPFDEPFRTHYDAYKKSVQSVVGGAPSMDFEISPFRDYVRTIYIPKKPEMVGPSLHDDPELRITVNESGAMLPDHTHVTLTDSEFYGYMMIANHIGIAGEPMIRALINRFPDPYAD